uniref:Uncharacterized protein n=1 Tax=Parascaris univalens TaxID=6257 RepID=A0A914ZWA4_PARUN
MSLARKDLFRFVRAAGHGEHSHRTIYHRSLTNLFVTLVTMHVFQVHTNCKYERMFYTRANIHLSYRRISKFLFPLPRWSLVVEIHLIHTSIRKWYLFLRYS